MRLICLAIYLGSVAVTAAAEGPAAVYRGAALVTRDCSRCHAVGRS